MDRVEDELDRIAEASARRAEGRRPLPVDLIRADRERVYARFLDSPGLPPRSELRLLEVGCGAGGELRRMMNLGLRPENLAGVELLKSRVAAARANLPMEVDLRHGDASRMDHEDGRFDVVFASLVFTSILSDELQRQLAEEMVRVMRSGGMILWYDFVHDNPRNRDVRGVSVARIRSLFPGMGMRHRRTTLAPPIARLATPLGPSAYRLLHRVPILRSHVVAAIRTSDKDHQG